METIGGRIKTLRNRREWSLEKLGREMGTAIGRKTPFSGEVVRLYEENVNRPSPKARSALAKVFGVSEQFVEFGPGAPRANETDELSSDERMLVARYRAAAPEWQMTLRTLAALATGDREAANAQIAYAKVPYRPQLTVQEGAKTHYRKRDRTKRQGGKA